MQVLYNYATFCLETVRDKVWFTSAPVCARCTEFCQPDRCYNTRSAWGDEDYEPFFLREYSGTKVVEAIHGEPIPGISVHSNKFVMHPEYIETPIGLSAVHYPIDHPLVKERWQAVLDKLSFKRWMKNESPFKSFGIAKHLQDFLLLPNPTLDDPYKSIMSNKHVSKMGQWELVDGNPVLDSPIVLDGRHPDAQFYHDINDKRWGTSAMMRIYYYAKFYNRETPSCISFEDLVENMIESEESTATAAYQTFNMKATYRDLMEIVDLSHLVKHSFKFLNYTYHTRYSSYVINESRMAQYVLANKLIAKSTYVNAIKLMFVMQVLENAPMVLANNYTTSFTEITKDMWYQVYLLLLNAVCILVELGGMVSNLFSEIFSIETVIRLKHNYVFNVILVLVLHGFVVWAIYRGVTYMLRPTLFKDKKVVVEAKVKATVFVNGQGYHEVEHNGTLLRVPMAAVSSSLVGLAPGVQKTPGEYQPEKLLPDTPISPIAFRHGLLAIVYKASTGAFKVKAMAFRVGDHLVTSAHVANDCRNATHSFAAVPFKQPSGLDGVVGNKTIKLALERLIWFPTDFFFEENGVNFSTLDLFARTVDEKFWSKLGVSAVNLSAKSAYQQQIATVGVVDGVLVGSVGKTLPGSGKTMLWHTASTSPGFSGSPVFAGRSVVGIHSGADSKYNVAIRIEALLFKLGKFSESDTPDREELMADVKYTGKSGIIDYDDYYEQDVWESNDGQLAFLTKDDWRNRHLEDEKDLIEYRDEGDGFFQDSRGRKRTQQKTRRPALNMESYQEPLVVESKLTPVYPGSYPVSTEVGLAMAEKFSDRAAKFEDYNSDYSDFEINRAVEHISLNLHLSMFLDRVNTIVAPPTDEEKLKVRLYLSDALSVNKYFAPVGYKTKEYLAKVINSSLIKGNKSAGYPYVCQGFTSNNQVLENLGVDGLTQTVLREWDEDYHLRAFLKAEPTKRTKLKLRMPRIVIGFPLHKTVKHQALFSRLNDSFVEHYRQSPVGYAFNPMTPGDPEYLWRKFPKNVLETDKSNWDYNMFGYVFDIMKDVIQDLIMKPVEMSEEEFQSYKIDVSQAIDEVYKECKYRLSDGTVYKLNQDGIMKSGWVLTIGGNTLGQLIQDTLVKFRMGFTPDDLKKIEHAIVCGGDDILQAVPDNFDVNRCLSEYRDLGFVIKEWKLHPNMEGAEFFSYRFYKRDGIVRYEPIRFTKHLCKLCTVPVVDLDKALLSHMENYCWNNSKFRFFELMYEWLLETYPGVYDPKLKRNSTYFRYKSKGYELCN